MKVGDLSAKILCVIGIIFCSYFLYLYEVRGVCLGHCNPLNYSLGLFWFAVGLFVHYRKPLNLVWATLGILGVIYFVCMECVVGFCKYCTILHIIGISAIFLSVREDLSRLLKKCHA